MMGEEVILKYFEELTPKQIEQFGKLGELYPEWNSKINVISRKDIENLYVNHILHSLSIAKFISFANGSSILDFGTGGGFPAIPLAVMFPNVKFLLVDRIAKKLRVAEDIANKIGLTNVQIKHGDIKEVKGKFDFIVSRAVMDFNDMIPLIKGLVGKESKNAIDNGVICLKGGDLEKELIKFNDKIVVKDIKNYFEEDFFETKKIVYMKF